MFWRRLLQALPITALLCAGGSLYALHTPTSPNLRIGQIIKKDQQKKKIGFIAFLKSSSQSIAREVFLPVFAQKRHVKVKQVIVLQNAIPKFLQKVEKSAIFVEKTFGKMDKFVVQEYKPFSLAVGHAFYMPNNPTAVFFHSYSKNAGKHLDFSLLHGVCTQRPLYFGRQFLEKETIWLYPKGLSLSRYPLCISDLKAHGNPPVLALCKVGQGRELSTNRGESNFAIDQLHRAAQLAHGELGRESSLRRYRPRNNWS